MLIVSIVLILPLPSGCLSFDRTSGLTQLKKIKINKIFQLRTIYLRQFRAQINNSFVENQKEFHGKMRGEQCLELIMEKIISDGSIIKKVIVIMLQPNERAGNVLPHTGRRHGHRRQTHAVPIYIFFPLLSLSLLHSNFSSFLSSKLLTSKLNVKVMISDILRCNFLLLFLQYVTLQNT